MRCQWSQRPSSRLEMSISFWSHQQQSWAQKPWKLMRLSRELRESENRSALQDTIWGDVRHFQEERPKRQPKKKKKQGAVGRQPEVPPSSCAWKTETATTARRETGVNGVAPFSLHHLHWPGACGMGARSLSLSMCKRADSSRHVGPCELIQKHMAVHPSDWK